MRGQRGLTSVVGAQGWDWGEDEDGGRGPSKGLLGPPARGEGG